MRRKIKPRRILLVEDHPGTLTVLATLLRQRGHVISTVGNLSEALEAASGDLEVDLLICDIGLPDGDGWELMTTLHARKGVPGIAVTGFDTPSDFERSEAAGFAFHLVKPIDPDELEVAIEKATKNRHRV